MGKKIKEDELGFLEWIDCGQGQGFWSRIEDSEKTKDRTPIICPACGEGIDVWAMNSYYRHSVCTDCAINYLEDREFPEGFFKNREARQEYVKQKIAEKTQAK